MFGAARVHVVRDHGGEVRHSLQANGVRRSNEPVITVVTRRRSWWVDHGVSHCIVDELDARRFLADRTAMRVVAVVQARVGSSRLPAKVLLDLGGKTALERCLLRVSRIGSVAEVVVATSTQPADDVIVLLCRRLGFRVVRGSEHDVLARYAMAANEAKADAVVRCTSDCPLIDPQVSGVVVRAFLDASGSAQPLDYVSNTLTRRLPRGLDTEIASAEALRRADRDAPEGPEREHVTMPLYRNRDRYRCDEAFPPDLPEGLGHHRWTLDTLEDYRFLYNVFALLGHRADEANMSEILAVLEENPALLAINSHVQQKQI